MPLLSEVKYSAALQYAVRASTPALGAESRKVRDSIKRGHMPLFESYAHHLANVPGADKAVVATFGRDVVLVPAPGSAVTKGAALWVPRLICDAMVGAGMAARVVPWLKRVTAVPKSAFAKPAERPSTLRHYETITVDSMERELDEPAHIVVVDDIVTSGSTLLASASRLAEAFPRSNIAAFALSRAISSGDVTGMHAPVAGVIRLKHDGRTWRDP